MDILFSVDSNYLKHAKHTILSLKHHTKRCINVHILYDSLEKNETSGFASLMKRHDINCYFYKVPSCYCDFLPENAKYHFSKAMYYRVFAPFILPNELDKVLYLDADIIIKRDISELYNDNITDYFAGVGKDRMYESEEIKRNKNKLSIDDEHVYFNSGVIIFNLKKIRNAFSFDYIKQTIISFLDDLKYPDQDILNFLFQNNVKYFDSKKFNLQVTKPCSANQTILEESAIIHYVSSNKPWNLRGVSYSSGKYYWRERIFRNPFMIFKASFVLLISLLRRK